MIRLSQVHGLRIYNDRARYVGNVRDIVLDDEEGKVVGLAFGRKGDTILSVPYDSVLAIGDIVLTRSKESEQAREGEGSQAPGG